MPIYLFECPKCGQEVESLQNYDDAPPTCHTAKEQLDEEQCCYYSCEHDCSCEPQVFQRKIGPASPQFKGSGFYETDYKSKK